MGSPLQMFDSESEANVQMEINYRDKDVFLRELIRSASDALDKIRLESLIDECKLGNLPGLIIFLLPDKVNKTLIIIDSGIGMTKADLPNNLGIIARSGGNEFLHYFAHPVAERVIVTTKHRDDVQYVCESQPGGFTVSRDVHGKQLPRGTKVTLVLKEDQLEYLEEERIKDDVVLKQSEFISYPICLWIEKTTMKDTGDDDEKERYTARWTSMRKKIKLVTLEWELIDKQTPIWPCKSEDISVAMTKLNLQ